jgi:hypothetical protein
MPQTSHLPQIFWRAISGGQYDKSISNFRCHPEAEPKDLAFSTIAKTDSSPAAQNDTDLPLQKFLPQHHQRCEESGPTYINFVLFVSFVVKFIVSYLLRRRL